MKDIQAYYGDKFNISPNTGEGGGGGFKFEVPGYQDKVRSEEIKVIDHKHPYRQICWKLNGFNQNNKIKGDWPRWPLEDLNLDEWIDDDEMVIYPSNCKFQFCLKSFYMDKPFTRKELDDVNKIYEKYGLNVMSSCKVKKMDLVDFDI